MPIGSLIGVLAISACTLAALRPLRRGGALGTAGYLVGMIYNELPVLAIGLVLATTLPGLMDGDPDRTGSRVAAWSMILPLAGLAWVAGRAVAARNVPEQAMRAGLGPTWRDEIEPAYAAGVRTSPRYARRLLLPVLRRRREVERVANIQYGPHGRRNRLDVYRHRSRPAGCPVLVHFHGGRFVSGAKNRESLTLLHQLAARGWLCISATYRLEPSAGFPDYVVDAKRVLAWVREHGRDYAADPGTVLVAGNSAGGYLATFLALTPGVAEYQPAFEDADTSVDAAIGLYGYYGRTVGEEPRSSPAAHVRSDVPPMLLVHGDRDSVIPVEWAREFAATVERASDQPVVYMELPGAQHSFDYFHSLRSGLVVDRIEAFGAWVRSRQNARTA